MTSAPRWPREGDIYIIPLESGLFGACVVTGEETDRNYTGAKNRGWRVAGVSGYWKNAPGSRELRSRRIMRNGRHSNGRKPIYEVLIGRPPKKYGHLGRFRLSPREKALGHPRQMGEPWVQMERELHDEWRWKNDRASWLRDEKKKRKVIDTLLEEHRQGPHSRRRVSRKELEGRSPFGSWNELWPAKAASNAQKLYRAGVGRLKRLGSRPRREAARRLVRDLVLGFNRLQEDFGCIETSEREEVFTCIRDIAITAGVGKEVKELTKARNW